MLVAAGGIFVVTCQFIVSLIVYNQSYESDEVWRPASAQANSLASCCAAGC
mgnify:CR=1 FL=1